MKYLPAQILFFVASTAFSAVRAAQLTSDGETEIFGYRGSIYTAHHYRPICGSLSPDQFTESLSVHDACLAPITAFANTPDTFALYTTSGIRQSDSATIARGTEYCMCYALGTTTGSQKGNFCIKLDEDGKTTDVQSNTLSVAYGRGFAEGNFATGDKALPQCFEIDLAAVTSSIDAAGTATHVQVVGPTTTEQTVTQPTGDSSNGANSPTTSSSSNNSSSGNKPQASSTSSSSPTGPAGLFVWLPILLTVVSVIGGLIYKHKNYKVNKHGGGKKGADNV